MIRSIRDSDATFSTSLVRLSVLLPFQPVNSRSNDGYLAMDERKTEKIPELQEGSTLCVVAAL